ncbi:MAG: IS200/IS605 family transposase [Planctomycetaceae bacterium]|nr:IS200/IS605 family transposase [Planctomycetaceae bacterium]
MSRHHQLLYHIVFSTRKRQPLLLDGFREHVFAYLAGIAANQEGFALRVGGYYDHVHLLVRIPAKLAVSDFVGTLKSNSSKHINDTNSTLKKFSWQDGFGAFTVSQSRKDTVDRYVERQMQHHRRKSFEDEYLQLLRKHEVDFDLKYVFD